MTEKEYIEREAALNAIKDEIENYQPNPDRYSITPYEFVRRGLNIAYSIIKNQPTADVQGVRYGKPVQMLNDVISEKAITVCSCCNGKISKNDTWCKHCGAKMDKE